MDHSSADYPARIRPETVSAVAMAVAAVAIAWGADQSTRWSGIMSISFSRANIERTESIRLTDITGYQAVADVILFSDWLGAVNEDDFERADSYRTQMEGEMATAMTSWLGDWMPGDNIPAGDPFDTGFYESPIAAEAAKRSMQAQTYFSEALDANQHSDNYILTTVIFASTLFFGGISTRFESLPLMRAFVLFALVFVVAGFGLMVLEPVTVKV